MRQLRHKEKRLLVKTRPSALVPGEKKGLDTLIFTHQRLFPGQCALFAEALTKREAESYSDLSVFRGKIRRVDRSL